MSYSSCVICPAYLSGSFSLPTEQLINESPRLNIDSLFICLKMLVHNGNCIVRGRIRGSSLPQDPLTKLMRKAVIYYPSGHAVSRMLAAGRCQPHSPMY